MEKIKIFWESILILKIRKVLKSRERFCNLVAKASDTQNRIYLKKKKKRKQVKIYFRQTQIFVILLLCYEVKLLNWKRILQQ